MFRYWQGTAALLFGFRPYFLITLTWHINIRQTVDFQFHFWLHILHAHATTKIHASVARKNTFINEARRQIIICSNRTNFLFHSICISEYYLKYPYCAGASCSLLNLDFMEIKIELLSRSFEWECWKGVNVRRHQNNIRTFISGRFALRHSRFDCVENLPFQSLSEAQFKRGQTRFLLLSIVRRTKSTGRIE